MKPFTVLVEGNIGVGKSTLLNYFRHFDDVEIVAEPIEKWQNLNGSNLLDLVYRDAKTFGFPFQMYTLLLMLQNHVLNTAKKVKILERSLFSAHNCFNKILNEQNNLKKEEYDILNDRMDYVQCKFNVHANLIVYLRTSPEQVFDRIKQRNRPEENDISLDYICRIHELHEEWLMRGLYYGKIPIIVLDASLNEIEIKKEYDKLIDHMLCRGGLQFSDDKNTQTHLSSISRG